MNGPVIVSIAVRAREKVSGAARRGFAVLEEHKALVLVTGIGAAVRVWGIRFGLPHDLARPDEDAMVATALSVFTTGDLNPHFFDWPSLFIYLTAAAYKVLFTVQHTLRPSLTLGSFMADRAADPSTVILVPRALSAAAGVATIVVLYAAASELFSRRAALVGATFLAVAYLHVRDSHFGVTDVPATLFVVCAFWAAVRCAARGATPSRVAIAGVVCGLAASTKYNAAVVLMPAAMAIAFDRSNRRSSAKETIGLVAVLLAAAALGFFVGTPFAFFDHRTFLTALAGVREHLFGGHGILVGRGWSHYLGFSLRYGLGLPLLATALAGACWLLVWRPWTAAIVLAFPLIYYVTIGAALTVFARYIVPVVPFLCLTAAVLVDRVSKMFGDAFKSERASAVCAGVLVVAVGASPAVRSVALDRLLTQTDTRVLGAQWIESRFPTGATMHQTGFAYGQLQPRPRGKYAQHPFNEQAGRFELNGQPTTTQPDIVVVVESPLVVYSQVPAQLRPVLDEHYLLATIVDGATPGASGALYDQQDAFYVPFDSVAGLSRPGPKLSIFERRHR